MARATFYDGSTGFPHQVRVGLEGDRLHLVTDEGHGQWVPLDALTRDGEGADWRFGRSDQPGWRLRFAEAPPEELARHLPGAARYGGWIDRLGLGKAALACALVAGLVLAAGYAAPALLAPHVPDSWEGNVGNVMVGDFGKYRCTNGTGQQALTLLAERIEPGATRGTAAITLAGLDFNMVNAAALPGRHIVLFDGLVDKAGSADAVAGVLAHEVAHVRRRHVTEALLRELGVGALIRLFSGSLGANAEQLLALRYTRANEAQADADAVAALSRANIDPRPTAALFRRLDPRSGKRVDTRVEWLESHPGSEGRAALFQASFDPRRRYRPALADRDEQALLALCNKPRLLTRSQAAAGRKP